MAADPSSWLCNSQYSSDARGTPEAADSEAILFAPLVLQHEVGLAVKV